MNHFSFKRFWRKAQQIRLFRQSQQGVTLPEVLVAMVIATLVVSLAFGAFFTLSDMINRVKLESERRIEFTRAFDFMTQEIRAANRVNQTDVLAVNATTNLAAVLANAGLDLSTQLQIPAGGTPVLYLEVPLATPPTTACPATFDRVVYDIRPNPTQWLGPMVITRYGRIPDSEGKTDPCSTPRPSDILVDSVAETVSNPTCSGQLTGSGGFFACIQNGLVQLLLESKVVDTKTIDIDSNALTRPNLSQNLAPVLSGGSTMGRMELTWTWAGSSPPGLEFRVYRIAANNRAEIVDATPTDLEARDLAPVTGNNCYNVVAVSGGYTSAESNPICANF
jgi:prepilin-type N-terminal cleavage/methylation domain-containing protein